MVYGGLVIYNVYKGAVVWYMGVWPKRTIRSSYYAG